MTKERQTIGWDEDTGKAPSKGTIIVRVSDNKSFKVLRKRGDLVDMEEV